MKIGSFAVTAIFISVLCSGFCFYSATVYASVPLDVIPGLVLDEYGSPVPNATVTLWQDGLMWQPNESIFPGITNPQTTRIEGDKVGSFLFGMLFPGNYMLTVEKYGYQVSASVKINNTTIHSPHTTNIVIEDFDVSLSQEQISYHGAIAGVLLSKHNQRIIPYANLYLWQNGQMVKITNNPQNVRDGNYSFKHLAPGWYEIQVVVRDPSGNLPVGNWSVNVGTDNVNADLVLPYAGHSPPPGGTPTPVHPLSTPSPTPTATPAQAATPTPSLGLVMILSSISLAALYAHRFGKSG